MTDTFILQSCCISLFIMNESCCISLFIMNESVNKLSIYLVLVLLGSGLYSEVVLILRWSQGEVPLFFLYKNYNFISKAT